MFSYFMLDINRALFKPLILYHPFCKKKKQKTLCILTYPWVCRVLTAKNVFLIIKTQNQQLIKVAHFMIESHSERKLDNKIRFIMISEPQKSYKTYKVTCSGTWWPTMIQFSNIDEEINWMKQQLDKTDIR